MSYLKILLHYMTFCQVTSMIIQRHSMVLSTSLFPFSIPHNIVEESLPEEVFEYANSMVDILKEATLPESWADVLAIGVSEGVAGLVGGLASVVIENIIGDKRKDSAVLEDTITGVYFGARGVFRGLAQVAGLPQPVAIFFADIAGSIASEGAKAIGRDRANRELDGLSGDEIGSFQASSTTSTENLEPSQQPFALVPLQEILFDVVKWVAYDLLVTDYQEVPVLIAARSGCFAGIIAVVFVEFLRLFWREESAKSINEVDLPTRLYRAGIEGAVLFAVYEASLVYCNFVFPKPIADFLEQDWGI